MNIDNLTFLSGAELTDKSLFMVCQDSNLDIMELPHCLFRHRSANGDWISKGHGPWISTGITCSSSKNGVVSLGAEGDFLELQIDGSKTRNNIIEENDKRMVTFRFIKLIDGILYAGGTNNYIFRFTNNKWTEIGTDAMRKDPVRLKSFENATGFNAEELYTFGWEGAIWSNFSGGWQKIVSPTKYILHDGDVHNEHVYLGGQLGTILKGRNDNWEVIQTGPNVDIWSVKSFGDSVYFSTMYGILRLKNDKITVFKELGPDMRTAMKLFVGPSGLWSVGASDIALFDGKKWHAIEQN